MADGSQREIQEVRLGEQVLTAEGRTGRVVRTLLRDEEGGLLRLVLSGHSHLRMTREHPVLTARGYVPASELLVGDEVALPKFMPESCSSIVPSEYVDQPSHLLSRGHRWAGLPGRRGLKAGSLPVPNKIELDENFGRLVGLFLAEGSCDSGKAYWSYNINEKDTLADETVRRLATYGVEAHVREIPSHGSCRVVIHGTGWTRLLSALCGNGSGLKKLHPNLAAGPSRFLSAVLSGWLAGDGSYRKDGGHEGISISQDLALGMYDIAQALGRHPTILRSEPTMNSAAKTRRPRWTVTMAELRGQCRDDGAHIWRKVREVRLEDYVGPVYDLTVEGDHSYVAEGVGVHNCTGNAAIGCMATGPFFATVDAHELTEFPLTEGGAVLVYGAATALDAYPGTYPPDDTGSDGLSVAKVLQHAGWISGYEHAFSLADGLQALMSRPVIVGVNWFSEMFSPDVNGVVHPTGDLAGGHEFVWDEHDADRGLEGFTNSWGPGWGVGGRFYVATREWASLLAQDGDVTSFVPISDPAPIPTPSTDPGDVLWEATKAWTLAGHVGSNAAAARAVRRWATRTNRT
jgi:hypothetical protein